MNNSGMKLNFLLNNNDNNPYDYDANYLQIKINSDNDLHLEKKLKLHGVIALIRCVIKNRYKNYS